MKIIKFIKIYYWLQNLSLDESDGLTDKNKIGKKRKRERERERERVRRKNDLELRLSD